jgi:hypothetical protein
LNTMSNEKRIFGHNVRTRKMGQITTNLKCSNSLEFTVGMKEC